MLERRQRPRVPDEPDRWATVLLVAFGAALCGFLVWFGLRWAHLLNPLAAPAVFPPAGGGAADAAAASPRVHPLIELLKLVMAAAIGIVVTGVHKRTHREKPLPRSMVHSQILLAVSGALMMIIIGESLARAFGIAGAAAIIRFRTPVKDPKDASILFLLMALGMSAGLGAFAVAGLGTVFLCLFLVLLDHLDSVRVKARAVLLEVVANGKEFPTAEVHSVFSSFRLVYEPREVSHGKEAAVKYHVTLEANTNLEDLSEKLMSVGAPGLKSVSWEKAKKKWTI